MRPAKLLSWNILQGGGKRADAIVGAIQTHGPDVIILSEIRTKSSRPILEKLRGSGWSHCVSTNPPGVEYGVAVLAREPILQAPGPSPTPCAGRRWIEFTTPSLGFSVGCTNIPAVNYTKPGEKAEYWDAVLSVAAKRFNQPFLLIGDFNTGKHFIDEPGKTFLGADRFEKLEATGWIDAWRKLNGEAREFTWYSKFKGGLPGNGFRIDHAFVTPPLVDRVRGCWYSHTEREAKTSDHSVLLVEIEPPRAV